MYSIVLSWSGIRYVVLECLMTCTQDPSYSKSSYAGVC